jgi:hypothetical protein
MVNKEMFNQTTINYEFSTANYTVVVHWHNYIIQRN